MADQDPWGVQSVAPASAPKDDPWGVASVGAAPPSDWRDRLKAKIMDPSNVPDTGWRGGIEKFGQRAANSLTSTLDHPLDTLGSMAEATPAGAVFDLATGRPNATQQQASALVHGAINDPVGTAGDLAGGLAAGEVAGPAVGGALNAAVRTGRAAGDLAGGVASAARNFRPTPAPHIVPPEETAAIDLTNAIGPEAKRIPDYRKAAQVEVPNILDYAKRTNNPLRTKIEFSKAAEGNAIESANHYNQNVLGPNAEHRETVPTTSGVNKYQPSGENPPPPTASLGDINQRIIQINKELSKPKLNAGDARTAMASDQDLIGEHRALTDILHRSLSNLTGIDPADIADLRQRVGRSREIANDTRATVDKTGVDEAKPGEIPIHKTGIISKAVNAARGGETAIGDRAFQRAIQNYPGQANPLPQVTGPRPQAPTASAADPFTRMANAEAASQRAQGTQAPAVKPLDKATAQDYYKRAGKDPEKAREMARKDGYSF